MFVARGVRLYSNIPFFREAAEERERLQKELDEMMEEERIKRVKEIDERDALRLQRLKMQETMIRQQIAERQVGQKKTISRKQPIEYHLEGCATTSSLPPSYLFAFSCF